MKYIPCLLLSLGLMACSTTPEDDAQDISAAGEGTPGVFYGEKGESSLKDVFGEKNRAASNQPRPQSATNRSSYSPSANVSIPAIDQQSFDDFENFKAWRRAQEPGSENYQDYQDWKAYQQYLRFKAQQNSTTSP